MVSATPTWVAIWLTAMSVRARSRICCFFAALIERQATLRMPRAVVISLTAAVDAMLAVLGSGATSPAIEAPMEGEQG